MLWEEGDADAGADSRQVFAVGNLTGGLVDAFCNVCHIVGAHVPQEDDELVPAKAPGLVFLPQDASQDGGVFLQDGVPVLMPSDVVGFLEMVEIRDDEGMTAAFSRGDEEEGLCLSLDAVLVEQAGQGIGLCHLFVAVAVVVGDLYGLDGIQQDEVPVFQFSLLLLDLSVVVVEEGEQCQEEKDHAEGKPALQWIVMEDMGEGELRRLIHGMVQDDLLDFLGMQPQDGLVQQALQVS